MVRRAAFEREWRRCSPWIEAALHAGGDGTTLEDVYQAVVSGRMHFWPALDAAVVTQLCSRGQELNIYLAGGSLERLREMLHSLEAFGTAMGCKIVTILGRPGWARSFLTRDAGYRHVASLLGKELPNEGTKEPHVDAVDGH